MSLIVVATAEPQGAYHLHALSTALRSSHYVFCYLSPDIRLNVGTSPIPTMDDISVIRDATRLILTGGSYTPWTSALHSIAESCNIEVRYSELAFLDQNAERGPYVPQRSSAVSDASAAVLAQYLGVPRNAVVVTGNPLVPRIGEIQREAGRVLVVSTVDAETRDPALHLRTAASVLLDLGYDVLVRLHPRENPEPWAGFILDSAPTVAEATARASVVLAYPGTPLQAIAQIGTPLVILAPTTELEATAALTAGGIATPWLKSSQEAVQHTVQHMISVPPHTVARHTHDEAPDSAANVVRFWTEP